MSLASIGTNERLHPSRCKVKETRVIVVLDPFVDEVQIDVNVLCEGFGAEPADRRNTWVRWGCG